MHYGSSLPSHRPSAPRRLVRLSTFVQNRSNDDNILSVAAANVVNANANNSISFLIRRSFPWITLAAGKRPSATCLTILLFSLRSRLLRNHLQSQHHNQVVKTGLWRASSSVLTHCILRHHVTTCDAAVYSILRRLCAPAPFYALNSDHQSGAVSHL